MQPTTFPHVNEFLERLLAQMQMILPKKLVGLYLYGSLVTGDFDSGISDIDLLAATSSDIDKTEFDALDKMQDDMVFNFKEWEGRLEIPYISLDALKTFKTQRSQIAIISPGEPFHFKEAGNDWLMNWYMVREKGVTLFGPPPKSIIEPISKAEFIQAVKEQARDWRKYINDVHGVYYLPTQAYAILTMCRALHTVRNGEQVSKRQAALWAEKELPEWSATIKNALLWRQTWRDIDVDYEATLPETRRFVQVAIEQTLK